MKKDRLASVLFFYLKLKLSVIYVSSFLKYHRILTNAIKIALVFFSFSSFRQPFLTYIVIMNVKGGVIMAVSSKAIKESIQMKKKHGKTSSGNWKYTNLVYEDVNPTVTDEELFNMALELQKFDAMGADGFGSISRIHSAVLYQS